LLYNDVADRIEIACPDELDGIIKDMWVDHTHGLLTDNDMEALDEAARTRREAIQARRIETQPKLPVAAKRAPRAAARRRQRSPDRQASIERRRRLAASGPMPPALAARFTTSELAALRIIGDEVRHHGVCAPRTPLKPLPRPTSFAGCRTTMSLAVRFRVETFEHSEGLPRKRPCPTPDQCPHARSACGPARLAVPESLANHANSIDGQTARAAASSQTQSALYQ
jgi:hypothetical protein